MMFQIEHGVPIPQSARGVGSRKYPMNLLKVGDSFFVPKKTTSSFGGVIHAYRKKINASAKFTTRSMKGGVRVWRVK